MKEGIGKDMLMLDLNIKYIFLSMKTFVNWFLLLIRCNIQTNRCIIYSHIIADVLFFQAD